MLWQLPRQTLDLTDKGAVMGILNVTPDSFSDGGQHIAIDTAVAHAHRMIDQGAAIIDIGGESTRPGAPAVPADVEMARTIPVIEQLRAQSDVLISIDTSKAAVARAATAAGADIINDVSGLTADPDMLPLCSETNAGIVIMHMQGTPRTMQQNPTYNDVVSDIRSFFNRQLLACEAAHIASERIIFDPGIGFGKTLAHNLALLRNLDQLSASGRPLLVGASLKSFIGKILHSEHIDDRAWPTVALTAYTRQSSARIFRVHEVQDNVDALRMTEAML